MPLRGVKCRNNADKVVLTGDKATPSSKTLAEPTCTALISRLASWDDDSRFGGADSDCGSVSDSADVARVEFPPFPWLL